MKKYYLAHSCQLIEQARRWEIKIQGRYYVDLVNPFNRNTFENVDHLKRLKTKRRLRAYMKTLDDEICKQIVDHDLGLLRKCDGVVAYFNDYTAGTMMEIFAGAYLYRIPVYVIGGGAIYHPWLQHLVQISGGMRFKTRREFEQWLEEQGLRRK